MSLARNLAEQGVVSSKWRGLGRRAWSGAKPTILAGRRFGSRWEAQCYETLRLSALADDAQLHVHPRFPLLNLAPDPTTGVTHYFTPDFVVVFRSGSMRVVDAKGRQSPEWARGRDAFVACYGLAVEEWHAPKRKKGAAP